MAKAAVRKSAGKTTSKRPARAGKRVTKPARRAAAKKPVERVGVIELAGKPATVIGDDVKVGQNAPQFTVQANDWSEIDPLATAPGKVRILAAVPSLDTAVCDRETKTFNQRTAEISPDIYIFVISTDLPAAQKRWCGAAGVEQVRTLSDHMAMDFGTKYGCYIKERRWLRRAVFVVGRDDTLKYVAYLPRLGEEPNYDEVLAAAQAAL